MVKEASHMFTQRIIDDDERVTSSTTMGEGDVLCRWTAERIAEGKIIGWFQGRIEWGARALGNRSILADPLRFDMRDIITDPCIKN
jgi:carbamoyltransferase